MRVAFIDVGRDKKSWEAEAPGEITYQWLYGQVKKKGALMSSGIDFSDDGRIFAGFRSVGRFEILPKAPDRPNPLNEVEAVYPYFIRSE